MLRLDTTTHGLDTWIFFRTGVSPASELDTWIKHIISLLGATHKRNELNDNYYTRGGYLISGNSRQPPKGTSLTYSN